MNEQIQSKIRLPDRRPHFLWRLLWVAMLLVHARPATAVLIADEAISPLSTLLLALSSLFFVLKIVDVPWLRFRTDFRAAVTWLLILGILHVGVLNQAVDQKNADSQNGVEVVLISCATAIGMVAVGRLILMFFLGRPRKSRSDLALICQDICEQCANVRILCLISRTVPRRGPPI